MNIKAEELGLKKLARRSHSVKELKKYLLSKEFSEEDVDEVINEFKRLGYLNDASYVEEYLRYVFAKNWSFLRAKMELKKRGVSDSVIEQGYNNYIDEFGEVDEFQAAYSEAKKVLAAADIFIDDESEFCENGKTLIPDKIKARVARRLSGRGFSASIIYSVLSKVEN